VARGAALAFVAIYNALTRTRTPEIDRPVSLIHTIALDDKDSELRPFAPACRHVKTPALPINGVITKEC
jgi:hypothetical protein